MAEDTVPPKAAPRSGNERAKRTPEQQALRVLSIAVSVVGLGLLGYVAFSWLTFPSDRTPEGAYYRVAKAVVKGAPEEMFPYIETAAQHASYTILKYRKQSRDRILAAYPEPERTRLLDEHAAEAAAEDGSDVFALYARRRGWLAELRRDLSAVQKVETSGERASVQTVRGTRYSFRRRENGIWGLTQFTAVLVANAEKAARDDLLIQKAADDYERARRASAP